MDTKNLKKLRIYIVDDHKLFREGLKLLLSTQDFVHHIYEASSGRDFIENLSFVDCDLVLMDIEMPEMNGIEATEQALRIRPDLKVIVLSMYGDEQYYYKMVDVGVKGFVLKNSGIEKVIAAIRAVAAGENYFSEELLVICVMAGNINRNLKPLIMKYPRENSRFCIMYAWDFPTRKLQINFLSVSGQWINIGRIC